MPEVSSNGVRRYYQNSILTREESIALPTFDVIHQEGAQGSVAYGAGLTINLGNFESVRVDVRIELPALPEEVHDAFAVCKEFVDTELGAQQAMLTGLKKGDAK